MVSKENILISSISSSFIFSFYIIIGLLFNSILEGVGLLFDYGLTGVAIIFFSSLFTILVFYPLSAIIYLISSIPLSLLYKNIVHLNNNYVLLSYLFFQMGLSLIIILFYINISYSLSNILSNQEIIIMTLFCLYGAYRSVRYYYKVLFNPEIKYLDNYK